MTLIVSEIGVNFSDTDHAKHMIHLSKQAGADAVKFQMFNEETIKNSPKRNELIKLILKEEEIKELKKYSDSIGIEFFSTPMYPEAVDILESIEVSRYKIRYADRFNRDIISKAIPTGKPIYISSNSLNEFKNNFYVCSNINIIYCIPEYPPSNVLLPKQFHNNTLITGYYGYSNHYPAISVPLCAVSRGANYVEIHVKENENCIDSNVSLGFTQFKTLITLSRQINKITEVN